MKKVFLIHGLHGSPNGGWRPWLMRELNKYDIYACALAMPNPDAPILSQWIEEVERHLHATDEIYLVGHSLGTSTILRYLEKDSSIKISGAVLASGPIEDLGREELSGFIDAPFDFESIKAKIGSCVVIHGEDDDRVPFSHAEKLSKELGAQLIPIPKGGHLNGKSGWNELPQALEALLGMINN